MTEPDAFVGDPAGPPFLYRAPAGWPQPDFEWMADHQLGEPQRPDESTELPSGFKFWRANPSVFDLWVDDTKRRSIREALIAAAIGVIFIAILLLLGADWIFIVIVGVLALLRVALAIYYRAKAREVTVVRVARWAKKRRLDPTFGRRFNEPK